MASYKNPYNNQQDQAINSIGKSLAEIFMPNSASNIAANSYNRQGQRYAQLAESSRLSDIEQNIANQEAIRQQEDMEYLATNPQVMSLLSNQLGADGRLGSIIARQLADKDPTLITNRFATDQAAGMPPEAAQNYARREIFNRGGMPTANFAFNEDAVDRINQRKIDYRIAAEKGITPFRMERDDNKASNRAEEGEKNRVARANEGKLNRKARADEGKANREARAAEGKAGRDATAQRDQNKNIFDRSKYTNIDYKKEQELLDTLAPVDAAGVGVPVEFTGDSEVDSAMHSFIRNQYTMKYSEARSNGKNPNQADRVALNGLARASSAKTKKYSTGFFGDKAEVPLYILQDLRQQIRQDQRMGKSLAQQLLGKFGVTGELQQQVIDDLIATSK